MSRLERLAPLSAFFVTAFVAAGFIVSGETPTVGDPAQEVASFYKDNETEIYVTSALISLGAVALVWFGASLRAHIRGKEGDPGRIATLTFAAAILIATGITIFAGIGATAADAADELPASTVQTINAFDNNMFFTLAAGTLLMYASLAVAILRHGAFPKWLGWIAVLLTLASLTPAGFFAFLLSGIYYPVLGALIYREQGGGPAAAPPPASAA